MMIIKPIYFGWNIGYRIHGTVKRSVINLGRSGEARAVNQLAELVLNDLAETGLDHIDGRKALADDMASQVLKFVKCDIDGIEFSSENCDQIDEKISMLRFHKHLSHFCLNLLEYEKLFELPNEIFDEANSSGGWFSKDALTRSELWAIDDKLKKTSAILNNLDEVISYLAVMVISVVEPIVQSCPTLLKNDTDENELSFTAPLLMTIKELPELIETMMQLPFSPEFDDVGTTAKLRERIQYNVLVESDDLEFTAKHLKLKDKQLKAPPDKLLKIFLDGTPFLSLFNFSVPITIPQSTRFEHHHIVAGSGHGKTQTLQHLILHDLQQVARGGTSVVVIDSQGDLINNIRKLEIFAEGQPLANRLIVIDPTDVEYPVSLNLFDVNMERINQYSQLDRERMVNGILELYDFVLGSLLGAEMTQKQSVIFRYITRLLLHIPNATIHTLRELLEEGGALKYQQYIDTLQGTAKAFFQSEFDSKEFVQTKRQVVRRLWGILENQSFERMFSHPKNKLDLYTEMNSGKVILINTAKDLLKENGTEIFGRFFIAMIAQAAQERSVIAKDKRLPTYVYIDEANDYFDRNIGIILSQARKYKVGMVLAHQFLGQLDNKLQEAVFANTSIKFAGGVSAKDARILASEMRTQSDFIESQSKLSFAAFIRGETNSAVSMSVKYGQMEGLPKMTGEQLQSQIQYMRDNFAMHYTQAGLHSDTPDDEDSNDADPTPDEPTAWE